MMNVSLDGKDLVAVVDHHPADADHVVRVGRNLALFVGGQPPHHGDAVGPAGVVEGEAVGGQHRHPLGLGEAHEEPDAAVTLKGENKSEF